MDDAALWSYLGWALPPLWAWVLIYALRTFKEWPAIMARRNEARRDTASAADALLARYENRVASLEAAEEKCRFDLTEALRRLGEIEGYMMGRGKASQDAQLIVSAEREIEAAKRDNGK